MSIFDAAQVGIAFLALRAGDDTIREILANA
jgi:hypothetical protein